MHTQNINKNNKNNKMGRVKEINLPDGTIILDGIDFPKLIVLDKEFARTMTEDDRNNMKDRPCKGIFFKTKAGRDALRITIGDEHTLTFTCGSGDRTWNNWRDRCPSNAVCAFAVATSNGGGCWFEFILMPSNTEVITNEQANYMEEIS